MDVFLTPELDQFVAEMVGSERFSSPSEVICEGLRLLKEQEALKREISIGIEQLEDGQEKNYESAAALVDHVKAEGRKRRGTVA